MKQTTIFFFLLATFVFNPIKSFGTQEPDFSSFNKYLFEELGPGSTTHAVVVLHKGKTVFERYQNGFSAKTLHHSWSIAKSIANALVGRAVLEKRIDIQNSICTYLFHINPSLCSIKIIDLLGWTSGLGWKEEYEESESISTSSVAQMLYGDGRFKMSTFVLHHNLIKTPGTYWNYSSGDSVLLSRVLKNVYSPSEYKYLINKFFEDIDAAPVVSETDAEGVHVLSSYVYLSPMSLVKLGQLFMNDGVVNGKRILPEGWVAFSTSLVPAFKTHRNLTDPGDRPGYHWWTNLPVENDLGPAWPNAPTDTFAARGHWGQTLAVIPSDNLILVRFANDRDGSFDFDSYLALARKSLGLPSVTPSNIPTVTSKNSDKTITYHSGKLRIASTFTTKELCSCRFVLRQTSEFCKELVKISPPIVSTSTDIKNMMVTGNALWLLKESQAKYWKNFGCRLAKTP